MIVLASNTWEVFQDYKYEQRESFRMKENAKQRESLRQNAVDAPWNRKFPRDLCALRKYSPHDYYDWTKPLTSRETNGEKKHPSPVIEARYLYGQWPRVLNSASQANKICLEQDHSMALSTIPFMDGILPSIVSRQRLGQYFGEVKYQHPTVEYVALASWTNDATCLWLNDVGTKPLASPQNQTMLLLLDASFRRVVRMKIPLEPDVPWGSIPVGELDDIAPNNCVEACHTGTYYHKEVWPTLEEARLLILDKYLWISYRNQDNFGSKTLLLNPVHFGSVSSPDNYWHVHIKASETVTLQLGGHDVTWMYDSSLAKRASYFGGSSTLSLKALSSMDPITVDSYDTIPLAKAGSHPEPPSDQRRQKQIHGTSSFLVHLPDRREYLGVGYLYRPRQAASSEQHESSGHFYTHFFFTMSDQPPYILTSLSLELVLPAAALMDEIGVRETNAAEVIQFWSGLEVVESATTDGGRLVVVAYGINDCESVVTTLAWSKVVMLLQPVDSFDNGTARQVLDMMSPLR